MKFPNKTISFSTFSFIVLVFFLLLGCRTKTENKDEASSGITGSEASNSSTAASSNISGTSSNSSEANSSNSSSVGVSIESLRIKPTPTFEERVASIVSTSPQASKYPWVQLSSEDLKVIVDPKVEAAFRLDLIRRAKYSIDIVTFDQRTDDMVGMPLLKAIKDAANRGVKIRFLTSATAAALKDTFRRAQAYLSDNPTKAPIEFHVIGGADMPFHGWNVLDGIHQKLFIVDKQINLTSGRGQGDEYLHWLDTGFVFKGKLVEQAAISYQKLWDVLKKEKFLTESYPDATKNTENIMDTNYTLASALSSQEKAKIIAPLKLTDAEVDEFLSLASWLDNLPVEPSKSKEVYLGRLLHVQLLEQLRTLADRQGTVPNSISFETRSQEIDDPIIGEIIDRLNRPNTKDFKFYSLVANFQSKLKAALLAGKKNGIQVEMFTNGKAAHQSIVPMGLPIGWFASLPDLDDLLATGVKVHNYVQKDETLPVYVHRKLAITGDTVFFGSHNLSLPSSGETDEVTFEIIGQTFADQMNKLFEKDVKDYTVELDPADIHKERLRDGCGIEMGELLKILY